MTKRSAPYRQMPKDRYRCQHSGDDGAKVEIPEPMNKELKSTPGAIPHIPHCANEEKVGAHKDKIEGLKTVSVAIDLPRSILRGSLGISIAPSKVERFETFINCIEVAYGMRTLRRLFNGGAGL